MTYFFICIDLKDITDKLYSENATNRILDHLKYMWIYLKENLFEYRGVIKN